MHELHTVIECARCGGRFTPVGGPVAKEDYRARPEDLPAGVTINLHATPGQGSGNGMAVTGMVLGIVGFVFAFIPCIGWIALLLGIIGILFSGIGLGYASRTQQGKGLAVSGLVLSLLAIIWWPLFSFVILAAIAAAGAGVR
jgi:hypothetical protein